MFSQWRGQGKANALDRKENVWSLHSPLGAWARAAPTAHRPPPSGDRQVPWSIPPPPLGRLYLKKLRLLFQTRRRLSKRAFRLLHFLLLLPVETFLKPERNL